MENNNIKNNGIKKNEIRYKYTFGFAFKQLLLEGWIPKPSLICAIIFYFIMTIIFVSIGVIIIIYSNLTNNHIVSNYQQNCNLGQTCEVNFTLDKTLRQPINFFIMIDGYYQNHRRYASSVNYRQLRGEFLNIDDLSNCSPAITNREMGKTRNLRNENLNPDEAAFPCGLIARSFFNDEFRLENYNILTTNITNPNNVLYRYKNLENENLRLSRQWIDMSNERFMNWMDISIVTNFKKLWGRIDTDLNPGNYKFFIENNWDVSGFDGKKHIELSEIGILNGKNLFLGYFYIAAGIFNFILLIVFTILKFVNPNNKIDLELKKLE